MLASVATTSYWNAYNYATTCIEMPLILLQLPVDVHKNHRLLYRHPGKYLELNC